MRFPQEKEAPPNATPNNLTSSRRDSLAKEAWDFVKCVVAGLFVRWLTS